MLSLIQEKNIQVKIVVLKLSETILYGRRRVVLLVHCFVPNVPISPQDLIYHFAKKQSTPTLDVTFNWKLCYQEFPGFYALRQHRNTQHGMQIGSETRSVDVEHKVGDVEDDRLREQLRSCHSFWADSEIESAIHKVFNYAVESFKKTIVNEKHDHFFNNLNFAAKVNMAFGLILENIED